jgi:hypothetical protein
MRPALCLAILFAIAAAAPVQAAPAAANDVIVVMQRVNTRYDQPGAAQTVAKALPGQTSVRPNENVSKIVSRLYSVGPTSAQQAGTAITAWIKEHNQLDDALRLKAGQALVVPDLPKLGKTLPGAGNLNNRVPRLSFDARSSDNVAGLLRPDVDRRIQDALRTGAAFVVSIRKLTSAQAAEAIKQNPDLILASAPLTLKFLDNPGAGGGVINAADAAAIRAAAARAARQHPIVFVFDDNWPSLQEEEASRTYVLNALRDLRAKKLIPPMQPFDPRCAQGAAVGAWPEAGQSHAAEISQSLEPLRAAAGAASPVKVVYVPLLGGGPCAAELIGQIAEFHLISVHMGDQLGQQPVLPDVVSSYHTLASQVAAKVDPAASADGKAKTDVEVVQAFFEFARRHGEVLGQPVFVSMSWDFPLDLYYPVVPSEFGGLLLAAAGNEGKDDSGQDLPPVTKTKVQFAERSSHPGDVLAVMNVDGAGKRTCQSSLVDPEGKAFATSFFGFLSQDDCGTSFSTPRVAWLIALREAGRPRQDDLTNLSIQIRADLSNGLNGPGGEPGVQRLNLANLLKPPQ